MSKVDVKIKDEKGNDLIISLTDKQNAFWQEYIKNSFNGTQAAIKAGYSEDSARFEASRLLTNDNIKQVIDYHRNMVLESTLVDVGELVLRLSEMVRARVPEAFNDNGTLKDLSEIPEDVQMLIAGIEVHELIGEDGAAVKGSSIRS